MKLSIDWKGMLKAIDWKKVINFFLPFVSGGLGGLLTGCTVGSGPNFTF